jgi:hypothetical protein
MPTYQVQCPTCGASLRIGHGHFGKVIACPKCTKPFQLAVPQATFTEPPPAPPPPSPPPVRDRAPQPPPLPVPDEGPPRRPRSPGKDCPECRKEVPFGSMFGALPRGGHLSCPHCKQKLLFLDLSVLRLLYGLVGFLVSLPLILVFVLALRGKVWWLVVVLFVVAGLVATGLEAVAIALLRSKYRLASLREPSPGPGER